jgi:hypothetical protein
MAQLGVTEQHYEEVSKSLLHMRQSVSSNGSAEDILNQRRKEVQNIKELTRYETFVCYSLFFFFVFYI